jgi:hypothetical protein
MLAQLLQLLQLLGAAVAADDTVAADETAMHLPSACCYIFTVAAVAAELAQLLQLMILLQLTRLLYIYRPHAAISVSSH